MRILALVIITAACSKSESRPHEAPPAKLGWIELDTRQALASQIVDQAKAASAAGKKPHAYLHADWCPPCVALETTRDSDARMRDAFAGTHIVAIDLDRADPEELVALNLTTSTIPIFYRLGPDGIPTGDTITGAAWGDNVPERMAPPLAAFFAK